MKKRRIILLSLILVICIVATTAVILITKSKHEQVLYKPALFDGINYNNYSNIGLLDYKDGKIAFIKYGIFGVNKVTVTDGSEEYGFNTAADNIQLANGKIVYLKSNVLIETDLTTHISKTITDNCDLFVVYKNLIVYKTNNEFSEQYDYALNELYAYDMSTGKSTLIHNNSDVFVIYKESVFALSNDGYNNYTINEISLTDYSKNKRIGFHSEVDIYYPQIREDKLIYIGRANTLEVIDIYTGETEQILIDGSPYVNNRICFICDEKNIYVSFQATKTNGSIVKDTENINNGLWRIDPITLKAEKMLSDTFDSLYLYNGDILFGIKGNNIYHIDINHMTFDILSKEGF